MTIAPFLSMYPLFPFTSIREELGSLSQVIDDELDELLKHGIKRREIDQPNARSNQLNSTMRSRETSKKELESTRERQNELRVSIDQLQSMMERSQREVGLDEDHFRAAISCALELLNAPPLIATGNPMLTKKSDALATNKSSRRSVPRIRTIEPR